MAETVIGRSKADTHALFDAFREMARTGTCPHCDAALAEPLERLEPLAGVHEYPSRVKCATLPGTRWSPRWTAARRRAVNDMSQTHTAWTPDGETAAEADRGRHHRRDRRRCTIRKSR